jgi:hypothetical protein
MNQFRIYAKISGLVEGETAEDAQKHAQRILTQLLEPKGFDVVGVAVAAGDRIPGRMATVETAPAPGAALVFKWLQQHAFSEEVRLSAPRVTKKHGTSLHEYPLVISLAQQGGDPLEAVGRVLEVSPEIMRPSYTPTDPETKRGMPRDPGSHMEIPEGQHGYGWMATTALSPKEALIAHKIAKRLRAEMERAVEHQLRGQVQAVPDTDHISTNPETDETTLMISGLFTTPVNPEQMARELSEKIGIRSMLPKEVAETGDAPKKGNLSTLLGSLIQ